jgi:hypothetical protein
MHASTNDLTTNTRVKNISNIFDLHHLKHDFIRSLYYSVFAELNNLMPAKDSIAPYNLSAYQHTTPLWYYTFGLHRLASSKADISLMDEAYEYKPFLEGEMGLYQNPARCTRWQDRIPYADSFTHWPDQEAYISKREGVNRWAKFGSWFTWIPEGIIDLRSPERCRKTAKLDIRPYYLLSRINNDLGMIMRSGPYQVHCCQVGSPHYCLMSRFNHHLWVMTCTKLWIHSVRGTM